MPDSCKVLIIGETELGYLSVFFHLPEKIGTTALGNKNKKVAK